MENGMAGASGGAEHHVWVKNQFMSLVAKSKNIGMKIDEMQEKILMARNEKQKKFALHEKFFGACNLLEYLCNIFNSANEELKEGNVSRLRREWGKLKANSANKDDCVSMLIERIQNISIETDGIEEPPQGAGSVNKKKSLQEEMELGLKFAPSLSVFEDDLINQSKFLRLERSQLEERVKRILSSFARIKLDLSRYENECQRMKNILLHSSNTLSVRRRIETDQMLSDMQEIEKRKTAMLCQWQENHNVICGLLDDIRLFNARAIKVCEKIWHLYRCCKQLNHERLELVYKHMGREP